MNNQALGIRLEVVFTDHYDDMKVKKIEGFWVGRYLITVNYVLPEYRQLDDISDKVIKIQANYFHDQAIPDYITTIKYHYKVYNYLMNAKINDLNIDKFIDDLLTLEREFQDRKYSEICARLGYNDEF